MAFCHPALGYLSLASATHRQLAHMFKVFKVSADQGAQTLVVVRSSIGWPLCLEDMVDTYTEVQVQVIYSVFPAISAVSRRMALASNLKHLEDLRW